MRSREKSLEEARGSASRQRRKADVESRPGRKEQESEGHLHGPRKLTHVSFSETWNIGPSSLPPAWTNSLDDPGLNLNVVNPFLNGLSS